VNSSNAAQAPIKIDAREPSGQKPTDEQLLVLIAQGDPQALEWLFQRYARVVRSVAARVLRDDSEAEDLVQDLFLFIRRKCSIFDGSKSSASSWIIQMTYQRAIERRRRLASRHFYKREHLESGAAHVVGVTTTERDYCPDTVFGRNGLEKTVAALSGDQRETLQLYFFEGYTLSEISAKIGQPLGNVRNHYYRGLDKLRKQMFGDKQLGI